MQDYNETWLASSAPISISTDLAAYIEIRVSSAKDCQLFGLRDKTKIPLKIGREFRIRCRTKNFDSLLLSGTGKTSFGYTINQAPLQNGEALNSDNPPSPPIPNSDNLVLQMRNLIDSNNRHSRMPVLDPEELPFSTRYEVDEPDDGSEIMFEEDIFISQQKAAAKAKAERIAEADKTPPATLAPENPPPPSVPEAPPGKATPPAENKPVEPKVLAAE